MTINEIFNVAISYYQQGNIKEAIETFENVIKSYPTDPLSSIAIVNLGKCYDELGDHQKAWHVLTSMIEIAKTENIDPSVLSSAHTALGIVYESMGYFDKAGREYKIALSISPNNQAAKEHLKEYGDMQENESDKILTVTFNPSQGEIVLSFAYSNFNEAIIKDIIKSSDNILSALTPVLSTAQNEGQHNTWIVAIQTFSERWNVEVPSEDLQRLNEEWIEEVFTAIFAKIQGGHVSVEFGNGEKYTGDMKDGKPHGQGTHTFAPGKEYTGEFKDGFPHGHGTSTYPDGTTYVGEFREGLWNGEGTLSWADGGKYVGEFRSGKRSGHGTLTNADGTKYTGEFNNGNFHGQGTLVYVSGAKYIGEFKNGKSNGQGTYTYPDGKEYKGEFRDGFPHGQGISIYPDGGQYVGEFN